MENKKVNSKNTFPRIAFITYHAAYNFGSVLQAYATQQILIDMGYSADIINYRMAEQKYFYNRICSLKYGIHSWINDITLLLTLKNRRERARRFEEFFQNHFILTEEVHEPEEVEKVWKNYTLIISGSDQIWNKGSCELRCNDWKYMNPYLLKGYSGRKISYASSVNSMSKENLNRIISELNSFHALSFRESVSSKKMEMMLHKPISTVVDPTFLLRKIEWINRLGLRKIKHDRPYILYYSLSGLRLTAQMIRKLRALAKKWNCKVLLITPYTYVPVLDSNLEYHQEYGPREFLEAIYNAKLVITNSYHGTVLSINFDKNFYSICERESVDVRKKDILERLGLSDRILYGGEELLGVDLKPINYVTVHKKLNSFREFSLRYLETNLPILQKQKCSGNK